MGDVQQKMSPSYFHSPRVLGRGIGGLMGSDKVRR
jgi:hypothetical protein